MCHRNALGEQLRDEKVRAGGIWQSERSCNQVRDGRAR
jgi:hypothetical protein